MEKKEKVQKMFDSIAYRYDLLNHLLSFGIDVYWRRKALKLTKINSSSILLDFACGTGDFAITAKRFGVEKVYGADLSLPMLKLFRGKSPWIFSKAVQTTAENPPFKDGAFTNITIAFGVRNFFDIQKAFISFKRILKARGKLTILEFSLPKNKIVKSLYQFYFKKILPKIGGAISKDKEAYTYLPESVNDFDENIKLNVLLKNAGFNSVKVHSLTFGIVQVVIAEK